MTKEWMRTEIFCEEYGQRVNTVQKRVHDGTWPRGEIYSKDRKSVV